MSTADVYWMAGLFEGQGHIAFSGGVPALVMASSDLDIVSRVATILGSSVRGPQMRRGDKKDVWVTSVQGPKAVGWLLTLFTPFGRRSRTRVRETLIRWRRSTGEQEPAMGNR